MSVLAKRAGWSALALLLLLAAAFLSLVRITVNAPSPPPVVTEVPRQPSAPAPHHAAAPAAPAQVSGEDPVPLIIPVQGVRASQLTDTWGQSRANGAREHHAIDIMAPRGTPVLAAASGTVEKLFESHDGGHTIYIRMPDGGAIHYYAHLDAYQPGLAEKQAVRQGEQIATVGSTGDASPNAPHLHFEIKTMAPGEGWWQGEDINPYPLLAKIGDAP